MGHLKFESRARESAQFQSPSRGVVARDGISIFEEEVLIEWDRMSPEL